MSFKLVGLTEKQEVKLHSSNHQTKWKEIKEILSPLKPSPVEQDKQPRS